MNKFKQILATGALVGVLGACTTAQLTQAQGDISSGIAAACKDVNAVAALNPLSPSAVYAEGACGTATAVAGLVQNSGTIQWLGQLQQQLAPPAPAPAAAPAT